MMKQIAIISDTHNYLDDKILKLTNNCDEIWHAGDFGYSIKISEFIEQNKVIGVYGNIDGAFIRQKYPEIQKFKCEKIRVLMTHIGGYPNKYTQVIKQEIELYKPHLYICGHSHILKVMYDKKYKLLHINPGAAGKEGFHKKRTIILVKIEESRIFDLEVIELGPRSKLTNPINRIN